MSENIEKTPEARWKHLKEIGTKTAINLSSHNLIDEKPAWFDEEKFARARETILKYYIG